MAFLGIISLLEKLSFTIIYWHSNKLLKKSALHAIHVEPFEQEGKKMVRFQVHPYQRDSHFTVSAQAQLLEWRQVRNSNGDAQLRPVIQTAIKLGELQWTIELTLTNRDVMGFRMLLGREGVRRRFWVNPGRSYLLSHQLERQTKHFF
nr:RimK/LysX family protein [Hydrococcus rivularis]